MDADKLLRAVHGEPRFPAWAADPARYARELGTLLDPFGLCADEWPAYVAQYESWVEEGKRLAEFTVAYGFPPDASDRSRFLLTLSIPYARALKVRERYEAGRLLRGAPPDPVLLSTYGIAPKDAERVRTEAMTRRMLDGP